MVARGCARPDVGKSPRSKARRPCVQPFGRLCHNDLVGRCTSSAILEFITRRNGILLRMEEGRVLFLIEDGQVTRCKSENHVPIVAVSKEPRVPNDPSQASGDRLQIPNASESGDGSHQVLQSDVPGQENTGQASGDRLHFPRV